MANLILDPLFIFAFHLGIEGAAIATVISQMMSACFVVIFQRKKAEYKIRLLHREELGECAEYVKNIVSLGTSGFVMQLLFPSLLRAATRFSGTAFGLRPALAKSRRNGHAGTQTQRGCTLPEPA